MKSEDFDPPFTKIAPYYDRLMSFVNYPSWVSYIERIILLNGIKAREILDIACGTGTCLELWFKRGYRVIGLDKSREMLQVCAKKFPSWAIDDGTVQFICGDLRDFSLPESVPVVTCLYDSLNYLLTEDELLSCFKSVFNNLSSPGLFIFDMNTIHSLKDEWGNQTFERHDGPIHSIWENSYDPVTRISTLRITLNVRDGKENRIFKELHRERAYPLEVIKNLLAIAGYQSTLYRHLSFQPASELDIRIMGVSRKV